jgi:hypothetical protein
MPLVMCRAPPVVGSRLAPEVAAGAAALAAAALVVGTPLAVATVGLGAPPTMRSGVVRVPAEVVKR